jgi:hypothetical protein
MKRLSILAAAVFLFMSCKKDKTPLAAVASQIDFLVNGNPTGGSYNFFSFSEGKQISVSDSATNKWDFAMRFETMIVNSGVSGPGEAGVQVISTPFDQILEAPESGYKFDTTASKKAVKGTDWYSYNPQTRVFSPIAGRTFVFRTAHGKYAKMEILSALPADDNGNLVVPPTRPTKIKYKIRIAYQWDGSRSLKPLQ